VKEGALRMEFGGFGRRGRRGGEANVKDGGGIQHLG